MIENRWIIVYGSYDGFEEKAVNRVSAALSLHIDYALPTLAADRCTSEELAANNIILIGTRDNVLLSELVDKGVIKVPASVEGYSLRVTDNPYNAEKQMIAILGYDKKGVLYGAVDFENKYVGQGMYDHSFCQITTDKFFSLPFSDGKYYRLEKNDAFRSKESDLLFRMPSFEVSESPAFKMRGLWTWGHCIYDYRAFFENMLTLKLNHVVIWNDHAPINAKRVVDCAHEYGIQVFWGFSWGWDVTVGGFDRSIDDDSLIDEWSKKVERIYSTQYASSGADGIYFQSFTETPEKEIDGVCIADAVTKWVNYIGGELLSKYPELHIQFGLHAVSVNDKLDYIKNIDKRLYIVWEDCGSFPYNYDPKKIESFEETLEFNRKIYSLRGKGALSGAVLKGMPTLDWIMFEHQDGPFVMGEMGRLYTKKRNETQARMWKYLQAYWIRNAKYVGEMISQIRCLTGGEALMQLLVEDGCFEDRISYPAAVAAEMLWHPDKDTEDILGDVANYPNVSFANL